MSRDMYPEFDNHKLSPSLLSRENIKPVSPFYFLERGNWVF